MVNSLVNSTTCLRKNLSQTLLKNRTHSYEVSITLITKPEKDITRKNKNKTKLQINTLHEVRGKDLQQSTSKLNPARYKKDHTL